jgi:hypothetical protein
LFVADSQFRFLTGNGAGEDSSQDFEEPVAKGRKLTDRLNKGDVLKYQTAWKWLDLNDTAAHKSDQSPDSRLK